MVVISTVLYALAAITVAARIFGAESVLYSSPSGWGELVHRPTKSRQTATVAGAMLTLALLFPAFFVVKNTIPRLATAWDVGIAPWEDAPAGMHFPELPPERQLAVIQTQLVLGGIGTVLLFGGLPWLVAKWRRITFRDAFSLRSPPLLALLGSALLGISLWTGAHELVLLEAKFGLVSLDLSKFEAAKQLVELLPQLPLPLILAAVAAAPAICEEWFFRGFLFSALRRQYSPWKTILISALLFGLFHVVGQGAFTLERLLPSAALGVVLGWICWRSGSIFPGMVMHFLHNGLVLTLGYYQNELKARGWDVTPAEGEFGAGAESLAHLPISWLAAGTFIAIAGFVLVYFGSATRSETLLAEQSSP
jgi:ABC-2 type transport system permease protein/sodium transport system permease protein